MVYHIQNIGETDTLLIIELRSSNKGYVSEEQDHEMTLRYLTEFRNIETLLKQKSYCKQINQSQKIVNHHTNEHNADNKKFLNDSKILEGINIESEDKKMHSINNEASDKIIDAQTIINDKPVEAPVKKKSAGAHHSVPVFDRESQNEIIESIIGRNKDSDDNSKNLGDEYEEEKRDSSEGNPRHRKTSSLGILERTKANSRDSNNTSQTLDLNFVKNNSHIHRAIKNKYDLGTVAVKEPKLQEISKEKGN
jgi:hypothetical protein